MVKNGFTLIELMFVVAVISILATLTLPQYGHYLAQAKVADALVFAQETRYAIAEFYSQRGTLPADAVALGQPATVAGLRVAALSVAQGAIHLEWPANWHGGRSADVLSLRPLLPTAPDAPVLHLAWVCGHRGVPDGFSAVGDNRTTLPSDSLLLPRDCRP